MMVWKMYRILFQKFLCWVSIFSCRRGHNRFPGKPLDVATLTVRCTEKTSHLSSGNDASLKESYARVNCVHIFIDKYQHIYISSSKTLLMPSFLSSSHSLIQSCSFSIFLVVTPWKINGWNLQPSPMNRKENDLPNLHDYVPC